MLPLSLGAAVWAACTVLLVVTCCCRRWARAAMKLSPPLAGVTMPEKARSELGRRAAWLVPGRLRPAGRQRDAALRLGRAAAEPGAVPLFGVRGARSCSSGPARRLFEAPYCDEYCSRNLAAWHAQSDAWAAQIRQMQDIEERRGQAFLYVLTPSKVAQYPDILPRATPARPRPRTAPAWCRPGSRSCGGRRARGGHHGGDDGGARRLPVPAVSARRVALERRRRGAVEQAVMAELHRLVPDGGFAPFSFTWHMIRHPIGVDVDIANLMNLIWPFPTGPVPVVDLQPGPAAAAVPGHQGRHRGRQLQPRHAGVPATGHLQPARRRIRVLAHLHAALDQTGPICRSAWTRRSAPPTSWPPTC